MIPKSRAEETLIIKIKESPDLDALSRAAGVIKKGGLAAFPTETVYGLGADALNPEAVQKIYSVKKRPADNPLIVHIADLETLSSLAVDIPELAYALIDRFWPGPLTIILKSSDQVPDITTGGLKTCAIRMPDHPVALALINEADTPLAAPSANISGRPSPTRAEHVICDFRGEVEVIIDGGTSPLGIESTVIDLSEGSPVLLRPGGTPLESLEQLLKEENKNIELKIASDLDSCKPRSPGMKYRHYAPRADLVVVDGPSSNVRIEKMLKLFNDFHKQGRKTGFLLTQNTASELLKRKDKPVSRDYIKILGDIKRPSELAFNLFNLLREFDSENHIDIIIAEAVSTEGLGFAVMNRLKKAAGGQIK